MFHQRRAGRVILLDDQNRTLLLQGHDPSLSSDGSAPTTWWFTPGGGAEANETQRDAALRELFEETGLGLQELQGPIWTRTAHFQFNGDEYEQQEEFYFARIDSHEVDISGWTPLENQTVLTTRWCSLDELEQMPEPIFPGGLAKLIRDLIEVGLPSVPIELSDGE